MERFTEKYSGQTFDLLIIGGGITGASVAYESASRGLSVALVEKNDFASATSSASSKMIHGGLRYLAQMEFKMVRESLRERRVMMNIAPNFVHPEPFLFAMYKHDKNKPFVYKAGMLLYDLLAYDKNFLWDKSKKMPSHRFLSKQEVLQKVPNVKQDGLLGGNLYYDCSNHSPERLTLAFIKSAVHYGANVANYAEMKSFISEIDQNGKIILKGAKIYDKILDKEIDIKSKMIVNCAGPWADLILKKAKNKNGHEFNLRRSEGIHFVTKKLVDNLVYAGIDNNNKHYFIIPYRNNYSLIGTTDKEFKGSPDKYKVTKKSIMELLDTVNSSFSDKEKIDYSEIKFTYGGLRPLVEQQTEDVYTSSRKYEITDEAKNGIEGLISVEGGKFTTSRSLAENVVKKIEKKLHIKLKPSISKKRYLIGSEIKNIEKFIEQKKAEYTDFNEHQIRFLAYSYGTEIDEIMKLYNDNPELRHIFNEDGENSAQIIYAVRNELAFNILDVLLRRTGIGQIGHPGDENLQIIANLMAKELNWSEDFKNQQIAEANSFFTLPN